MQNLDRFAIEKLGIPQIALMENAGKAVADNIAKNCKPGKVCVVAYKGNNGGDGFVAARHLKNLGFDVSVFLLCDKAQISGSAKINLDTLRKIKISTYSSKIDVLEKLLKSSNVVIDAIFGIGLSGEITGIQAEAIDLINKYHKEKKYYVVAVDVPSGVNATTGKAARHAIQADLTVTFAYPKTGLLKFPAVKNVGRLVVADIGIPYDEKQKNLKTEKPKNEYIVNLPQRQVWTNKGDYGKVLIVAGSRNMSGAAYLTAAAAMRSGAGLVYLAVPESIQKIVAPKMREIITIGLPETNEVSLSFESFDEISKIKADVIAIGPGLTTHPETKELVKKLVLKTKIPKMVLDADGLNCISDDPSILNRSKAEIVITPHPGEMSRLTGKSVKEVQDNREKISSALSKQWGVEVVLKGAYTIVANTKKVWINSTGNPGMASAGVGDVLTGMIAGFIAQGFETKDAVFLHGLAGDLAAKEKGEQGLIASDIIEKIPYAIRQFN